MRSVVRSLCYHRRPHRKALWSRCAASWVAETETPSQPVSQDSLAGIPWAGRSTLPHLMQRVAKNGPKDPAVWRRFVQRADVIAHSFTAKNAAMMLTAFVRAQHRDEPFLRRFCVKFVPSLVPTAELIDLCGLVSGLSQLGAYREETFTLMSRRLAESAPQLDAKQLTLVANAFVRVGHIDEQIFLRLLQQVPRRLGEFQAKEAAMLLNALAQVSRGHQFDSLDVREPLQTVALRLPDLLPSADLHSLTLILNAFAQMEFMQKDALDLISEELLADRKRLRSVTPRQLAMLLNAMAKLQMYEPVLLEELMALVRSRSRQLDGQALCLIANASAKLRLGLETFKVLYTQVPRLLSSLTARQLAMICHAWAKAHIHNDDLFSLLTLPLARKANELTGHEVAITVYGFAHFRKALPEVFEPLLEQAAKLLGEVAVSQADLLMLGNALGRVGWHDAAVADGLKAYVLRDPAMTNLTPQAIATFGLASLPLE